VFESFFGESLYFTNSAVLSVLSTGNYSGIVVDSGLDNTYIVPVYEGKYIKKLSLR